MKRTFRILGPFLILLGAGLIAGLLIVTRKPPPPRVVVPFRPVVQVIVPKAEHHRFIVESQGTVRPRTEIQLVAEVSGRILKVAPAFETGGFFEKGEVLVQIDPRDYESALTQAKAALEQARVQLLREEAEAQIAQKEWSQLLKGSPSPLLLHQPQLAEARARVAAAQANVDLAQLNLDRCTIRAPFTGRVRTKNVDVGQYVMRGMTLAQIYAVDYAEIGLPLSLRDLAYVDLPIAFHGEGRKNLPQPRVILSAEIGGRRWEWTGRIVRTEGVINERTRMITAIARVKDPYGRNGPSGRPPLAVGLFVHARIEGKDAGMVYLVPRSAFRDDRYLMVVDAQNRLHLRTVTILRRTLDGVIFRARFAPGDRICITPLEVAIEGMEVRVLSSTNSVFGTTSIDAKEGR